MKRLKGPELKMPDLKVPPFLADIYYDMRDRRLLPVVALVVVAIVAVPFLLGSSPEPVPVPGADEVGGPAVSGEDSTLTVVEAKPGLRDYRKRLRGRTPTDPFTQRYTGLPESAQLETSSTSSTGGGEDSVTEIDTTTITEETSPSGGGSPGTTSPAPGATPVSPAGGGSVDPDGMRFFGYRPDVRFGVAGSGDLALHEDLPVGSLLPKKKPLLIFIGVSQNGERATFDVSPEVTWVRGGGDCVGGKQACQILILHEGDAVDLLTETPGRSFRLKIESIDFVEVDFPSKSKAKGSRLPRSLGLAHNFSK